MTSGYEEKIESLAAAAPAELGPALRRAARWIAERRPLVVAYSGGVDSGLLAYLAHRVLGDDMTCAIGVSPSLSDSEARGAEAFLRACGIPFVRVETNEMGLAGYRENTGRRCYFCKGELFARIAADPALDRFACTVYGANADDAGDYRPGAEAAAELGVGAPLAEAGLGKSEVRVLARAFDLSIWDKPAAPCLASRVPYHTRVTPEKLAQIEAAEAVLDAEGFRVRRVRHYGGTARVEVPAAAHERIRRPDVWRRIVGGIERAGFASVELEADGFRSGRLNETLDADRPKAG